jgi:hypothetical protein
MSAKGRERALPRREPDVPRERQEADHPNFSRG